MNGSEALVALREIGLRGQLRMTGHPEWQRIFMIDAQGITQGRISLRNGLVESVKFYVVKVSDGPHILPNEIYPTAWTLWTQRRERIDVGRWNMAIETAKRAACAERDEKQAWRNANPLGLNARGVQKTRKRLLPNVRKHLYRELFGAAEQEKNKCTPQ
jgi:hypothetical protein